MMLPSTSKTYGQRIFTQFASLTVPTKPWTSDGQLLGTTSTSWCTNGGQRINLRTSLLILHSLRFKSDAKLTCDPEFWDYRPVMKFREHPLMIRKSGMPTWPPVWTTVHRDVNDRPNGEIGTLESAMMHDLFDRKIFMFIRHDGNRFMGSMHFDDAQFCGQVFIILQFNIGRSIKEIGDLDLTHLL